MATAMRAALAGLGLRRPVLRSLSSGGHDIGEAAAASGRVGEPCCWTCSQRRSSSSRSTSKTSAQDAGDDEGSFASSSKYRLDHEPRPQRRRFASSASSGRPSSAVAAAVAAATISTSHTRSEAQQHDEAAFSRQSRLLERRERQNCAQLTDQEAWVAYDRHDTRIQEEHRSEFASPSQLSSVHGASRKGKERQVDEGSRPRHELSCARDTWSQPSLPAIFYVLPQGHPGPPQLFVPTVHELLNAVKHLPTIHKIWKDALRPSNFLTVRRHLIKAGRQQAHFSASTAPPFPFLCIRALEHVRTTRDVRAALQFLQEHIFKPSTRRHRRGPSRHRRVGGPRWDVYHIAYAYTVLAERALRDLQAGHLIPLLLKHILVLSRLIENRIINARQGDDGSRVPHTGRRSSDAHLRSSRYKARYSPAEQRAEQEQDAVEELLVRLMALLTDVQDTRALHAANRLLGHVGARSSLWYPLARSDATARLGKAWTGDSRSKEASSGLHRNQDRHSGKEWRASVLALDAWARRRRRVRRLLRLASPDVFDAAFLARLARVTLGSSASRAMPGEAGALDCTVLRPSPVTSALSGPSLRPRDPRDALIKTAEWLDQDVAQQCLRCLRTISMHDAAQCLSPSDIAIGLLVAVRAQNADESVVLLRELDQVLSSATTVSTNQAPFDQTFFRPRMQQSLRALRLEESLAGPLASHQDSSEPTSAADDDASPPAGLEAAIFHYIDQFARKDVEGLSADLANATAEQPYSQTVSRKLFLRLTERRLRTTRSSQELVEAGNGVGLPWAPDQTSNLVRSWQQPTSVVPVKGIETLARDVYVPVSQVLRRFGLDVYGRDLGSPAALRQVNSRQEDLSGKLTAYGHAIRGFALRGEFRASETLFRALLRRSHTMPDAYPRLKLNAFVLSFWWTAETLRVQALANETGLYPVAGPRKARQSTLPRTEARRALEMMMRLIDVHAGGDAHSLSIASSAVSEVIEEHNHVVQPSPELIGNLVFSLSTRWGARWAAVAVWFATERRWPAVVGCSSLLEALLLTARAIRTDVQSSPPPTSWKSEDPALAARRVFRQWLFAQHPELHPVAPDSPRAPTWLLAGVEDVSGRALSLEDPRRKKVPGKQPARRIAAAPLESTAVDLHSQGSGNISAGSVAFTGDLFHAYAQLLSSILSSEKKSTSSPGSGAAAAAAGSDPISDAQPTVTELVQVLAWMRTLGIQPSKQTLCLVAVHMARYYRWHSLPWPRGHRFAKGVHSAEVAARHTVEGAGKRRYEAMGPLNEWLAEWVEERWPTAWEVASYARFLRQKRSVPRVIWDME